MNQTIHDIQQALRDEADPLKADFFPHFFKLEPGDKDTFLGVTVPKQRVIVKRYYRELAPEEVPDLLHSDVHEERLTALLMWVMQYKKGDETTKEQIYHLYLKNTRWVNNWDLVDSSASYIVGDYIFDKDRTVLDKLAVSRNIWERRIAILAAGEFIKRGEFEPTLKLTEQNLADTHHYIHKATGWMLREVGKQDRAVLLDFLDKHAHHMPRTALRYSIEHLDSSTRKHYMKLKLAK